MMALPTVVSMVSSVYIQWIKHEMKEKMEYENLQTITLNNNEFSWYEKGNEIVINGELFDVKHYSTKGTQTTFQGIFDKEESNMSAIAERIVSNKSENRHLAKIGGFFQILQYLNDKEDYTVKFIPTKTAFFSFHDYSTLSPILKIPTPPPEICLS
jgi:hypothetical protein